MSHLQYETTTNKFTQNKKYHLFIIKYNKSTPQHYPAIRPIAVKEYLIKLIDHFSKT